MGRVHDLLGAAEAVSFSWLRGSVAGAVKMDNANGAVSFLSINGIETELVQKGAGRPLLFLHPEIGLSPTAPFVDRLAERFTFIGPSHPGFGHSARPPTLTSVDDLAYFYLDFMETLNLRDVVLVGNAFGGWIAAEIATKSQERISHLVLANPVGIKTGDREHRDLQDIFGLAQAELDARSYHDPAFARFDPQAATEDEIYVRLRNRESAVRFGWSPYMHNPKLAGRLHRIRVPSLMLWGESDRIASVEYGQTYAARIDGARFETIAQAGRFPQTEQPGDFARRIAEFVTSNRS
jgi:pimeloyl-ACP methyl ester carboxylesterase